MLDLLAALLAHEDADDAHRLLIGIASTTALRACHHPPVEDSLRRHKSLLPATANGRSLRRSAPGR